MDFECLIEKIDGCKNNPKNSSTTKVSEHIPSVFSVPTISSFKRIKNKHDVCRCKDWMRNFCEALREHVMKIINSKKKKLSYQQKNNKNRMKTQKSVIFVKKKLKINMLKIKKHRKVMDHCHYIEEYRGDVLSIYNLKYSLPEEILIVFHNESNYDYYFIIKELVEKFEGQFTCLGKILKNT